MIRHIKFICLTWGVLTCMLSCGSAKSEKAPVNTNTDSEQQTMAAATTPFNADSAYSYVEKQVRFGPRVPNTTSHRQAGQWLAGELRRHGAEVTEQKCTLIGFDGEKLEAVNIFGRFNPDVSDRVLLLAHWDSRPWADKDLDPQNHTKPVDGANDGASGTGVLLELARVIGISDMAKGIDILLVDAEDRGTDNDEDSWALGTQYFLVNTPVENYQPREAILLDMVGGHDATFYREYFSQQAAPGLADNLWAIAGRLGYGDRFINRIGTAVTDDHVQLIKAGIPAVDIIEFNPEYGFNPRWHTVDDTMEGIDRSTLKAVGDVVTAYLGLLAPE